MHLLMCMVWFCVTFPLNAKDVQCHSYFDDFYNVDFLNCCCQKADSLTKFPEIVTNVSGISVSNNRIKSLDVELFTGLENILYLDLNQNKLTKLEVGIFDSLINLKTLSIMDNQLTRLDLNLFDSLTNVENMDLVKNKLTHLDVGLFDSLTKLSNLKLQKNKLKTLDVGLLDSLVNLSYFDPSENLLENLLVGVFDTLVNLEYLTLQINNIMHVDPGLFDSLTSLSVIYLSVNQFQRLDATIFYTLTSLRVIFLRENQHLRYIDIDLFGNGPYRLLDKLDWKQNDLISLCAGMFDSLVDLQILHLNENQLEYLEPGLFDVSRYMENLYLHGNKLTHLGKGLFDSMVRLASLRLDDNKLAYLTEGIFESLGNLQHLTLEGNQLVLIEAEYFESLSNSYLSLPVVCSCSSGKNLISLSAKNFITIDFKEEGLDITNLWLDEINNCQTLWIVSSYCSWVNGLKSEATKNLSKFCPSTTETKDLATSSIEITTINAITEDTTTFDITTSTAGEIISEVETEEITTLDLHTSGIQDTTSIGPSKDVSLASTGPTMEGIIYTVLAVLAAAVASVISYYLVSTKGELSVNMMRDNIPDKQYEDAIVDMFLGVGTYEDGNVKTFFINIPPLSYKEILSPENNFR